MGFIMGKRFRVAFSFAGEKRSFVSAVAEILADVFGQEAILYDKYHEAEFAARKLGLKLPNLYYKETDLIVTVFCPVYDKKLWTGLEWTAIHAFMVDNHDDDVLLARFDFAEVEGLYKTAGFIELDDKTPKEFATLILQRLALNEGLPRDHYLKSRTSSASPKGDWRIPVATSFFTGQEEYMTQIGEKLAEGKAVKIGQAIHLSGFGGVGKTALALEYAQQNQGKYENGYFLRCETADTLTESLVEIGGGSMTGSPEEITAYAEQGLAKLDEAANTLVILDNADVLFDSDRDSDLLRRTFEVCRQHHLLVTARPDAIYNGLDPLAIESMGPEVGGLFFYRLWKNDKLAEWSPVSAADQKACREMSEELGGLPLALEQAGAIAYRRKLRPDELIQDFRKRREEIMKASPMAHNQISQWVTVEAILNNLSCPAQILAFLLAFMSPEHVDERLFTEWQMELPEQLIVEVRTGNFEQTQGELLDAVLCKRVNENDPYQVSLVERSRLEMHRAVQAVIQEMTGEHQADWWWAGAGQAAFALLARTRIYEGIAHAELSTFRRQELLGSNNSKIATNLNNLAIFCKETNRFSEAETFLRSALAIDENHNGGNHTSVAGRLNNLAMLFQDTNRLFEAEPLLRRAIEIYEQDLESDRVNFAVCLGNLGLLLRATNRFQEAEFLMNRVIEIYKAELGENHPKVAVSLNNLAGLLMDTNRTSEAELLWIKALEIDERHFGPDHSTVAIRLNNLALLFKDTGRILEAEPLAQRALKINEKNYGTDHPIVATCLNNLGLILGEDNRFIDAEILLRKALEIDASHYSIDHPNVARDLGNLATILKATNRVSEAESLMRRTLEINEKNHGKDHPHVARSLNNLAMLLVETNRYVEAEPLTRRAIEIDEGSYDVDHPSIARDLGNLAALLAKTGRFGEARPLIIRSLTICVNNWGLMHPKSQLSLDLLGEILTKLGKSEEEAIEEIVKVLQEAGMEPPS